MTVEQAIIALHERGVTVRLSDIPGLYWIDGYPELTTNQVISIASGPPAQGAG